MTIRNRLASLEQRNAQRNELSVIIVSGGWSEGVAPVARAGVHTWDQLPEEPFDAFKARAKREARAAGKSYLLIGELID